MKSAFLRLAGVLSLGAVCCYLALAALPLLSPRPETALLYTETVRPGAPVYGVFLRRELVLSAWDKPVLFPEGQRAFAGQELGQGLISPAAGIFTAYLDGYEHISAPGQLTVQGVRALCADRRPAVSSPGKLITSGEYSFWALIKTNDLRGLSPGDRCVLETSYWGGVELTLEEIGESWQDFSPLRFSGDSGMDTVLYLRRVSGSLVFGEYTGLHIPDRGVYSDGSDLYALALSLGEVERVPLELIYQGDGYKLVTSELLWPGSEVILDTDGGTEK
ncbi:MAG: hypothetical protein ACOX81_03185 [Candidatus Heteroscillospira sp.]